MYWFGLTVKDLIGSECDESSQKPVPVPAQTTSFISTVGVGGLWSVLASSTLASSILASSTLAGSHHAVSNTTKIPRKDSQEIRKNENCGRRGKKAKFWAVQRREGGPVIVFFWHIEFRFFIGPFLPLLQLSISSQFYPELWPQMILPGCHLPFCQSPSGPHLSVWWSEGRAVWGRGRSRIKSRIIKAKVELAKVVPRMELEIRLAPFSSGEWHILMR